jgi:putative folate metabolism gamma-glutamate ligase
MKVKTIKTGKIKPFQHNLNNLFDRYLPKIKEGSILAVTSKIISICEGRVIKIGAIKKEELIRNEADLFLPCYKKYKFTLTIKNSILIPTAGIDESNGDDYYILWPKNPQKSANEIREYLCNRFKIKMIGVIITDSTTSPLRRGTKGIAITHSGFRALNNYIGQKDIFGKKLEVTQANIADSLAATAVLLMGEGREQTPLAVIENIPFVKFYSRNPNRSELSNLRIEIKHDLYYPLLKKAGWQKGKFLSRFDKKFGHDKLKLLIT